MNNFPDLVKTLEETQCERPNGCEKCLGKLVVLLSTRVSVIVIVMVMAPLAQPEIFVMVGKKVWSTNEAFRWMKHPWGKEPGRGFVGFCYQLKVTKGSFGPSGLGV